MSEYLLIAFLALQLSACKASPETPPAIPPAPAEAAEPSRAEPHSLADWRTERIELPPEFAPDLPAGEELLLFAPGMFDAAAPDYWSYAFVLRLEEQLPDAARLDELLELYYDGLIGAVARSRGLTLEGEAATLEVRRLAENEFEADLRLVDAFVSGEDLELRLRIDAESEAAGRCLLRFQASPQAPEHPIWQDLERAVTELAARLRPETPPTP